jgi:hypothetical protein
MKLRAIRWQTPSVCTGWKTANTASSPAKRLVGRRQKTGKRRRPPPPAPSHPPGRTGRPRPRCWRSTPGSRLPGVSARGPGAEAAVAASRAWHPRVPASPRGRPPASARRPTWRCERSSLSLNAAGSDVVGRRAAQAVVVVGDLAVDADVLCRVTGVRRMTLILRYGRTDVACPFSGGYVPSGASISSKYPWRVRHVRRRPLSRNASGGSIKGCPEVIWDGVRSPEREGVRTADQWKDFWFCLPSGIPFSNSPLRLCITECTP